MQDALDVKLGHLGPQVPMHDEATVAIQDAAQVEKGATEVDVTHVDVPVQMRPVRLHESGPLLRGPWVVTVQATRGLEHAPDGLGAASHQVLVDHAKGQAAVAVERMGVVIVHDGLFLLWQEPVIARNAGVVLVGFAIAQLPVEELGAVDAEPADKALLRKLRFLGPGGDEVNDLIAQIMRNPAVR